MTVAALLPPVFPVPARELANPPHDKADDSNFRFKDCIIKAENIVNRAIELNPQGLENDMRTVKEITLDLLRKLGVTTVVGNPGSTEETFLKNFPADFDYVLALQEASVVAIADGLSQSLRKPVVVNIHTGAGLGNAMGCILTAYQNKTPLIITAGQQTREMVLNEPLLTNIESINMPKPWVKWSYEPARPEDIPGAFMRAYATAMQQPQGPVFLSLPLDDWDKLILK